MGKIDDLQATLDRVVPVIDAIAADQTSLVGEIAALKEAVAAGTATEAGVQAALDKATAIEARLKSVDASVPASA